MAPLQRAPVLAEVTEGFGGLPALRSIWEEIFLSRSHEPSSSFEWTAAMVRHHVREGDRCFLVRLVRDQRVAGLVPLVLRDVSLLGRRVGILAPLSEEYNTHSDLLLRHADDDHVAAFVAALFTIDRWDCFRLARLLAEGPLTESLTRVLDRDRRLHASRHGLAAYVLALPASYETYLGLRSAKFRNYLKRIERKVQAAGESRIEEVDGHGDLDRGYDAVLAVERSSWKQEHGSSIVAVERQAKFYRDLCLGALEHRRLHLQWLTIAGQPVAYNMGYLRDDGYHYLKTSYHADYRTLSPSTYLRARLIRSLIERGITHFDFPGEPYEWESQWTDTFRWRTVMSVYPRTIRGRLLSTLERLKHRRAPVRTLEHVDPRAHPRKTTADGTNPDRHGSEDGAAP